MRVKIEALLERRAKARFDKDWVEADRIRNELSDLNIEVMDGQSGVRWRISSAKS